MGANRDPRRLEAYAQALASGMTSYAAALKAGYSESYSLVANQRLGKLPEVVAVVKAVRDKGMNRAAYSLERALKDCDDAAAFARSKSNSMALVKAFELKSKLAGLLIERVELASFSIVEALTAAKLRALGRERITIQARASTAIESKPEQPEAGQPQREHES